MAGVGGATARWGVIGTTRRVSDDEAAKREARRVRFAGMDARSADATREAAPAAPRVPWSGGVMTVIMPQRLQADCPPDSERGGLRFEARQHTVDQGTARVRADD